MNNDHKVMIFVVIGIFFLAAMLAVAVSQSSKESSINVEVTGGGGPGTTLHSSNVYTGWSSDEFYTTSEFDKHFIRTDNIEILNFSTHTLDGYYAIAIEFNGGEITAIYNITQSANDTDAWTLSSDTVVIAGKQHNIWRTKQAFVGTYSANELRVTFSTFPGEYGLDIPEVRGELGAYLETAVAQAVVENANYEFSANNKRFTLQIETATPQPHLPTATPQIIPEPLPTQNIGEYIATAVAQSDTSDNVTFQYVLNDQKYVLNVIGASVEPTEVPVDTPTPVPFESFKMYSILSDNDTFDISDMLRVGEYTVAASYYPLQFGSLDDTTYIAFAIPQKFRTPTVVIDTCPGTNTDGLEIVSDSTITIDSIVYNLWRDSSGTGYADSTYNDFFTCVFPGDESPVEAPFSSFRMYTFLSEDTIFDTTDTTTFTEYTEKASTYDLELGTSSTATYYAFGIPTTYNEPFISLNSCPGLGGGIGFTTDSTITIDNVIYNLWTDPDDMVYDAGALSEIDFCIYTNEPINPEDTGFSFTFFTFLSEDDQTFDFTDVFSEHTFTTEKERYQFTFPNVPSLETTYVGIAIPDSEFAPQVLLNPCPGFSSLDLQEFGDITRNSEDYQIWYIPRVSGVTTWTGNISNVIACLSLYTPTPPPVTFPKSVLIPMLSKDYVFSRPDDASLARILNTQPVNIDLSFPTWTNFEGSGTGHAAIAVPSYYTNPVFRLGDCPGGLPLTWTNIGQTTLGNIVDGVLFNIWTNDTIYSEHQLDSFSICTTLDYTQLGTLTFTMLGGGVTDDWDSTTDDSTFVTFFSDAGEIGSLTGIHNAVDVTHNYQYLNMPTFENTRNVYIAIEDHISIERYFVAQQFGSLGDSICRPRFNLGSNPTTTSIFADYFTLIKSSLTIGSKDYNVYKLPNYSYGSYNHQVVRFCLLPDYLPAGDTQEDIEYKYRVASSTINYDTSATANQLSSVLSGSGKTYYGTFNKTSGISVADMPTFTDTRNVYIGIDNNKTLEKYKLMPLSGSVSQDCNFLSYSDNFIEIHDSVNIGTGIYGGTYTVYKIENVTGHGGDFMRYCLYVPASNSIPVAGPTPTPTPAPTPTPLTFKMFGRLFGDPHAQVNSPGAFGFMFNNTEARSIDITNQSSGIVTLDLPARSTDGYLYIGVTSDVTFETYKQSPPSGGVPAGCINPTLSFSDFTLLFNNGDLQQPTLTTETVDIYGSQLISGTNSDPVRFCFLPDYTP